MELRIAVAGSRFYNDYNSAKVFIKECLSEIENNNIIFVSGGCRGADSPGERFAIENSYPLYIHKPLWNKFGKAAGLKRNNEIAQKCDIIICFWDGESRGTNSMINLAKKYDKKLYIKTIHIVKD